LSDTFVANQKAEKLLAADEEFGITVNAEKYN
jgi:hypothetical protein